MATDIAFRSTCGNVLLFVVLSDHTSIGLTVVVLTKFENVYTEASKAAFF